MRLGWTSGGTAAGMLIVVLVSPAQGQEPAARAPNEAGDRPITLVGCVQRESDYRPIAEGPCAIALTGLIGLLSLDGALGLRAIRR